MQTLVAAMPMYDWPEVRAETDAAWAGLRRHLLSAGFAVPERLARRNADLPAVAGGIRDPEGRVIAPDPATLDPDDLDLQTLWKHPDLVFAQTCWGPMEGGLEGHVTVLGQPDYSAFEGGEGELYSSAVVMRRSLPFPLSGGSSPDPMHKGEGKAATLPLDLLRSIRFAYNGPDSMSGLIALTRDLAAAGKSLDIFSERIETGAHRSSIVAVAESRADVCAVDCRTWDLARRFEPRAGVLAVIGWTKMRKGLPYVAARRFAGNRPLERAVLNWIAEQA